jgi:rubredoxin
MTTHAHTSPIDFEYRKRIFAAATVIILCTQFQIMQMTQGESRTEKANWNDAEIEAMLDYLILHRSKLAGTTFKMSTFNEAAADIGTKNLRTQGPPKTGAHCRTKWNAVSASHTTQPPHHHTDLNQLKGAYNQINKYLQKSGVHWDPARGANNQGTAAEEAWSDYVSKQVCDHNQSPDTH